MQVPTTTFIFFRSSWASEERIWILLVYQYKRRNWPYWPQQTSCISLRTVWLGFKGHTIPCKEAECGVEKGLRTFSDQDVIAPLTLGSLGIQVFFILYSFPGRGNEHVPVLLVSCAMLFSTHKLPSCCKIGNWKTHEEVLFLWLHLSNFASS